jgi:hypothetical protein
MMGMWQTSEVIRRLGEADRDELLELIEEASDDAAEALHEWVRTGDAPKSLYDAMLRFTTTPAYAFDQVDWDEVVEQIRSRDEQ